MKNNVLYSNRVQEIYSSCLLKSGEEEKGIKRTVTIFNELIHFNRLRIFDRYNEIHEMLMELPESFMVTKNKNGDYLRNAYKDKDGKQWTGLMSIMRELFALGLAANIISETDVDDDKEQLYVVYD